MAVARKLVAVAWLMLKHGEPYRYARPERMATKFAQLRSKYRPRGSQAPALPDAGLRTAARAGLSSVYTGAGLPPVTRPDELPAGERRMLAERQLTGFVEQLYRPATPRSKASAAKAQKPRSRSR